MCHRNCKTPLFQCKSVPFKESLLNLKLTFDPVRGVLLNSAASPLPVSVLFKADVNVRDRTTDRGRRLLCLNAPKRLTDQS